MSGPQSKFMFYAYGMSFGPYDTFEQAAIEGAAYAERCVECEGGLIKRYPDVTVRELRPPAH